MKDIALLILRITVGGLLAGHGAQKLFGWFGGPGLEGTAQWLESTGLKPGDRWAFMAGLSEFGGGVLTALGLFHHLGVIGILSAMGMATAKVHGDKPIWVTEGGAELPVTNIAAATALAIAGPGRFSLDRILGIRTPRSWIAAAVVAAVATFIAGITDTEMDSSEAEAETEVEAEVREREFSF